MANFYIGLMSGTSIDSVDAVVASFEQGQFKLIGHLSYDIPDHLKQAIQNLCQPGIDTVQLYAETDQRLGELFAQASLAMMAELGISSDQILAIGSHGQTVRHAAPGKGGIAFTQQIGDPNTIAARTGCPVVADFRRKDMALGGHGAPLVPAFHQQLFSDSEQNRVIVNIGGIANISVFGNNLMGYDIGPGNVLMDSWTKEKIGADYDESGKWAETGFLNQKLFDHLMKEEFIHKSPPKSSGTDYFNIDWIKEKLKQIDDHICDVDIQRTLAEFTAAIIAEAINNANGLKQVAISGGGSKNKLLMDLIKKNVSSEIVTTDFWGMHPDWVEAAGFAYLAYLRINDISVDMSTITGSKGEIKLGNIQSPN